MEEPTDFLWPVDPKEASRLVNRQATQATALMAIQLIVDKYKGTIDEIDIDKNQIKITVPEEVEVECSIAIGEVLRELNCPEFSDEEPEEAVFVD